MKIIIQSDGGLTVEEIEIVESDIKSIKDLITKELQNVIIFKLKEGDLNYYLSPSKNKYKEIN